MKGLLTLAAVALLTCTISYAQSGSETMVRRTGGSTAMMFTLNGLQNLGAGNFMGGFGINHFLSDDFALRGGLGFGMNSRAAGEGDAKMTSDSTTINIAPGLRVNLANNKNIAMYVGGQVMFGISSTTNKTGSTETGSSSSTSIGVGGFAGAEWFPWDNVSLGLEYGLGFNTTSGSSKNAQGTETDDPSTTSIMLGLSTVQFNLAFYFN